MIPPAHYHPGEDGGTLGIDAGVAIRARLRRITARLDRIETAVQRRAALPRGARPRSKWRSLPCKTNWRRRGAAWEVRATGAAYEP